ncbi:MAG TPA: lipopolysaccharide biosynthesis protein [Longimicrobiaceae bacterium]|nr:lipopolysaccharide biosynthesis protein [Longimicrobiaceae bacterium]
MEPGIAAGDGATGPAIEAGSDAATEPGTMDAAQGGAQSGMPGAEAGASSAAPGGFGAKLKRLGSESLIYGLSSILGRLLSYLLQGYYAHEFAPAENGIQSVVYSFIPIISIALYLGMDVAYMRSAAAVKDGPLQEKQRVFSMSFGMVLAVGGAVAALAFAATPWLAPITKLDASSFRYMIAIVYTDALLAVPYAHLRMTNRSLRYAILRLLFIGISIGLNILLITSLRWGVEGIFVANLVANLVILALFLGEIAGFFRPGTLRGAPWKALWKYALPIMPAMLAVMLVENGDRIVLNYLPEHIAQAVYGMTSKDVVGIYSFNYKVGVAMMLVVQTFRMAWTPFSLTHARQPGAPQLFSRVLTVLMLICGAMYLGVSVLLPSIVRVPWVQGWIHPGYWPGLPIVPVILLGYVFSGMYSVVTAGLYIERKTGVLPWIAGIGAVLNIGICLVAERHWGMVGVAWATPAAYAVMAALGAWQSNRAFPVPYEWGRLVHLGAIVAAIFAADRWITHAGLAPLSVGGVGAKLALLLAFPLLLALTRFFRHGELTVLRGMIPGRRAATA